MFGPKQLGPPHREFVGSRSQCMPGQGIAAMKRVPNDSQGGRQSICTCICIKLEKRQATTAVDGQAW